MSCGKCRIKKGDHVDITFNCTFCGRELAVDEAKAGQSVKCPKCGIPHEVPHKSIPAASMADHIPKKGGSRATGLLLILSSFLIFLVGGGDPGNPRLFTLIFFLALMVIGILSFSTCRRDLVSTVSFLAILYMFLKIASSRRLWEVGGLPMFDIAEFFLLAGAVATACTRTPPPVANVPVDG